MHTQAKKMWSDSVREQTRAITDHCGGDFCCPDGKLHLKNIAGGYAYIDLLDLCNGVLKVVDKDAGEETLFDTTDELLEAGWVID